MNAIRRIVIAVAFAGACLAQNAAPLNLTPELKYFKLEFTVKELDGGKIVNSRKYVMTIGSDQGANSIRSGDKIPVHTGNSSQFTYTDVGVNIDCRYSRETANGLALSVTADISNTAPSAEGSTLPQIIRTNRWNSTVLVPLKKATVVFSSDDPATNHQMQLELLAAPLL